MTVLDRELVRELLSALLPLRLASFAADFADVSIAIDVQSRMGCTPTVEIKGLRLTVGEVEATIEALAHLTDRLGVFARELGAAGTGDEDDEDEDGRQDADEAARRDRVERDAGTEPAAPPPPPPPVTPPLGTRRKGRPPGARNKPKAAPPAPPPEPAPSGPEAAPLPDPPVAFTRAPAEPPPPPSTPVHEPPAQLTLPNPLPEPPDLTPDPAPVAPLAGDVLGLLERLEDDGGSGDPRGWTLIPPEVIGEAVARKLVRPLGGVEGAPALLRLTDTGWAELEKGRA